MIRSLFVSMQELNKGARRPQGVPATKVKKIGVIGAGFMGASVGYVSARAGIDVVLIDRDQESADKGKAHAQSVIEEQIKKGRASERDRDAIAVASSRRPPITPRSPTATSSSRPCSRTARSRPRPMPRRRR